MKTTILNLLTLLTISFVITSCHTKHTLLKSKSKLYTDSIYSKHLSEFRKHNIYLPKNFNPKNKYPIIYATDGSEINEEGFYFRESMKTFDSLIDNNIIKPFIFIASYYNKNNTNIIIDSTKKGNKLYYPFRNIEYQKFKPTQINDSVFTNIFNNHMLYFKNELISHIEHEFNQHLNKNDRYFYGSSAGAGFGISLLNDFPNKIGTYICFSTSGGDIQLKHWKRNITYPTLYFQYGIKEEKLQKDADYLRLKYQVLNSNYYTKQFNGGHNYEIWDKEFIKIITQLFKTN
ncbi:MAG: alpha/beta hydrolase [Flavobacteriaceae bacterium]